MSSHEMDQLQIEQVWAAMHLLLTQKLNSLLIYGIPSTLERARRLEVC